MIKTLSIREIEAKASNIYEAIIVLAKRARQINDEQKQFMVQEQDYDDDFDDFDDFDVRISDEEIVRLPKPSTLSLGEFQKDDVRFDYGSQPSSESGNSESK